MVVLGLDPGIARTGFGVIRANHPPQYVSCGILSTPAHQPVADRLQQLGHDLTTIIERWHPERAIVETVLFGTNAKTAMVTAEVRGMLLYLLREHRIAIHNLTPLQIKSRMTGYGQASKEQMQSIVQKRLNLSTPPQPDDAADALAAALCVAEEARSLSLT